MFSARTGTGRGSDSHVCREAEKGNLQKQKDELEAKDAELRESVKMASLVFAEFLLPGSARLR